MTSRSRIRSDELLDRWKREAGSPLPVRVAVAAFVCLNAAGLLLFEHLPDLTTGLTVTAGVVMAWLTFAASWRITRPGPMTSLAVGTTASFYAWLLMVPSAPRTRTETRVFFVLVVGIGAHLVAGFVLVARGA